MRRQHRISTVPQLVQLLTAASSLLLSSCQDPPRDPSEPDDELDDGADGPEGEVLDERQRLAKSGQYLVDPGAGGTAAPATIQELVAAIDVNGFTVDATLLGADASVGVFEQWGVIGPRRGESFAVLSTGVLGTTPEPGTDMSSPGQAGDLVRLELELEVPEGFTRLSFDYDFLSAESPDYVGSIYNDTFTATLIDPGGVSHEIALASVNSSTFFDASAERAGGTTFDIFTANPDGVDAVFTGGLPDAGITDFQTVAVDLASAGSWRLVFEIRDLGDGIFDSAVVIDDVRVHAMEELSLNPPAPSGAPSLVADDGTIMRNPIALAEAQERVRGIAADGATRVMLRTRVPGPGEVEYALEGGTHPADGGVGELDGPFGDSVVVEAIETAPGVFHAFAAYQAPADFDRGTDGALATRPIELRASFAPDDVGVPFFDDIQPLWLVRPPVVLVHGLWNDNPLSWTLPLLDDPRLSVHTVSHTSSAHLASQANAIPAAILAARVLQHQERIAGSQVDLVAHGTGGLLARQHLDSAAYANPGNFVEGDVHKLITLNAPHLGSSFATATMEMWNSLTPAQRMTVGNVLGNAGMAINDGAIEDVQLGAPLFELLDATEVPSHAVIGSGGRFIPREPPTNSPALIAVAPASSLYTTVENLHPISKPLTAVAKRAFIFGDASQVFDEDHDAFSDISSQQGGIAAEATTTIASHYTDANDFSYESIHYRVKQSASYSSRILELLDEPTGGPSFASFPAPLDAPLAPMLPAPEPSSVSPVSYSVGESYGLTISSPLPGTEVTPGGTVEVSVVLDPGIGDVSVLGLVTPFSTVILEPPTFPVVLDMPVPEDAAGAFDLIAFGFSASGDFLFSSTVELGATPNAELVYAHIQNRNPFLFGVGDSSSTSVAGIYDDGINRDITSSAAGTEYLSSNASIFTVTGDGELVATGMGKATLIATNDGIQDSVTVEVLSGVSAEFDVIVEWNGGYCASLEVTNYTARATDDWEVTIDMGDDTILDDWNGVFSGPVGMITVGPEHVWQLAIPGGATKGYTGFCATTAPFSPTRVPTIVDASATF